MSISRLFRVLMTILILVSLVVIVVSAYRRNQKTNEVIELSDATTSIVTHLSADTLAWKDEYGRKHSYIVDPALVDNLDYTWSLGRENYVSRVLLSYGENLENEWGPVGPKRPQHKLSNALSVPVALRLKGKTSYARLKVIVWKST